MLALFSIGWILAILLTLFTYYKKARSVRSLIDKIYGKEESKKTEEGSEESNHENGTSERSG
jgi:hypothetical protein